MGKNNYMIVEDKTSSRFEERINGYLKEGWSLHGNLIVTSTSTSITTSQLNYHQAMIKEEPYSNVEDI